MNRFTKVTAAAFVLATGLASGASAGSYSHGYKDGHGYKSSYSHKYNYNQKHDGYGKSHGWHNAAPVIIVPAYKTCVLWSHRKDVCLKWY